MDNTLTSNQKRADKKPKKKKQPPLKVVYITNPVKVKATASEFRALVQELTGQGADVTDYSRFTAANGVGAYQEEVTLASVEGNAYAVAAGGGGGLLAAERGSDLSTTSGSYGDEMMMIDDSFEGLADSSLWSEDVHLDVFKSLGTM